MMKKSKLRNIILIIIVLLVLLLGGILGLKQEKKTSYNENGVVVKENVTIIEKDNDVDDNLIRIFEDELGFESDPKLESGDVLVAGIIDGAPAGFIRKVITVEKTGETYTVKTENAMLTDVFEELHLNRKFVLLEHSVEEVSDDEIARLKKKTTEDLVYRVTMDDHQKEYDVMRLDTKEKAETKLLPFGFGTEIECVFSDSLSVVGNVEFASYLELELNIEKGEIAWGMALHTETNGELSLGCREGEEAEYVEELFEKKLKNIQFQAGPVPIVLTNELKGVLEVEASLSGEIEYSYELESSSSNGFLYESKTGKVKEIDEEEYNADGLQWNTVAQATGTESAGVRLVLKTMLYDCTGAQLGVGITESAEAQLRAQLNQTGDKFEVIGCIGMEINPLFSGDILIEIPIIDEELTEIRLFEVELPSLWKKEWTSSESWEADLKELEEVERSDNKWYPMYSVIIKDLSSQISNGRLYFPSTYVTDSMNVPGEYRGGVSAGYTLGEGQFVYALKDYSNPEDDVPELFVGLQNEEEIKILSIYTICTDPSCNLCGEERMGIVCACVDDEYNKEIHLSAGNMWLIGNVYDGGELYLLTETSEVWAFASFRKGQDEQNILSSDVLDWEPIDKWGWTEKLVN